MKGDGECLTEGVGQKESDLSTLGYRLQATASTMIVPSHYRLNLATL